MNIPGIVMGVFFVLFMICVAAMNNVQNSDNPLKSDVYSTLDKEWYISYSNVHKSSTKLPTYIRHIDAGTQVVLETELPDTINDGCVLATRSVNQNLYIYVDGELRSQVVQNNDPPYRKDVCNRFVFVNVGPSDSGRVLKIVADRPVKGTRVFKEFYCGSQSAILAKYTKDYAVEIVFAIVHLFFGIVLTMMGIVIRHRSKSDAKIDYIGYTMILIAIWDVTFSEFRDFIFKNSKAISLVPTVMLILLPMAMMLYFDSVQEGRHRRGYVINMSGGGVLLIIGFVLQSLQLVDLKQFMPVAIVYDYACIVFIWTTIAHEIKGKIIESRQNVQSLAGLGALTIGMFIQTVLYVFVPGSSNGIPLCIGYAIFGVSSMANAVQRLVVVSEKNKAAIAGAEVKKKLLASMSHELRTPINAMLGMNEMILGESTDEKTLQYALAVNNSGLHLLSLVNDVLDYTKLEAGSLRMRDNPYSVKDLIIDCFNMARHTAVDKGLDIYLEVDKETPAKLVGDEKRVLQIFVNLLTNAVKYTTRGHVGLKVGFEELEYDQIMLCASIEDTGCGIPADKLAQIFEVFTRLEKNEESGFTAGIGIGLAITGNLVHLMGGTITVESSEGKGSKFSFRIPQRVASGEPIGEIEPEEAEIRPARKTDNAVLWAPDARVLIVDDVQMNLKVAESLLKDCGLTIDTALSADDAIKLTHEREYDCIILDHMMPEKDGVQAFHEMKADPENLSGDIKYVMLSANAVSGARESYLEEGFDFYLSKPYSGAEIRGLLLEALPKDKLLGADAKEQAMLEKRMLELAKKAAEGAGAQEQPAADGTAAETAGLTEGTVQDADAAQSESGGAHPFNPDDFFAFLDRETADKYVCGDMDFYHELISNYVAEDKRADIRSAYEAEDWENYRIMVHAVKSTSLMIGAVDLSEEAKALEASARALDIEAVKAADAHFAEEYDLMIEKLKKLLG